jgi:hypothetical protein
LIELHFAGKGIPFPGLCSEAIKKVVSFMPRYPIFLFVLSARKG